MKITMQGAVIDLSPMEYKAFKALFYAGGQAVARDALVKDLSSTKNSLKVVVSRIRKKFRDVSVDWSEVIGSGTTEYWWQGPNSFTAEGDN